MSEDLDNGPGGIVANRDWQFIRQVPGQHAIRLSFTFNAAWENMIWICNGNTRERLDTRGNYFRSREDFVTDIGRMELIGLVAYHKTVSPDAGDAGDHPWIQSPMKILFDNGVDATAGWTDGGDPDPNTDFRQAVCTVSVFD